MTKTINLDLKERSYDIIIAENLLASSSDKLQQIIKFPQAIIVTDENIPGEYIEQLQSSLGDIKTQIIKIKPGESSKSFAGLESLLDKIFATSPERKTTLIALGGGVIGDLTGFAASILLRGVNFIQIPTTLLAQVDSSVGGKTGINNKFGKNLVGSFYQPKLVLIDTNTLSSLPDREFKAGYAEILKYALINNAEFFDYLDQNIDKIMAKDTETLQYIIAKSCQAKADIVAQDERESDARALLNLGHTFGHALEQQMGYDGRLVHGEAVAIGMIFAFELSKNLNLCQQQDIDKIKQHLEKAGLPSSPLDIQDKWNTEELMKAMTQDKKVSDGKLVFILAKGIGQSFIEKNIDSNIVRDTVNNVLV